MADDEITIKNMADDEITIKNMADDEITIKNMADQDEFSENSPDRKHKKISQSRLEMNETFPDMLPSTWKSGCRLAENFYCVDCETLARRLLGQVLVRCLPDGRRVSGVVVETECYLGEEDKASHSYKGKRTTRNAAMFMKPATAYVYTIYGMYFCLNISSQGDGAAVLIRALEPIEGIDYMQGTRNQKQKQKRTLPKTKLCNGPSKLCQALDIDKTKFDQQDLSTCLLLWLEKGGRVSDEEIVTSTRIGIGSSAEEWAKKPLRFYVKDCQYVSKRDKSEKSQS